MLGRFYIDLVIACAAQSHQFNPQVGQALERRRVKLIMDKHTDRVVTSRQYRRFWRKRLRNKRQLILRGLIGRFQKRLFKRLVAKKGNFHRVGKRSSI